MSIVNFIAISFVLIQAVGDISGTCVLESDFGFVLNCNFKKSGLFRVRNLGGLKAHFGVGLSLGDELGFAESLGNTESERKRAISYNSFDAFNYNYTGTYPAWQQPDNNLTTRRKVIMPRSPKNISKMAIMTDAEFLPLGVPAFKTIPKKKRTELKPTATTAAPTAIVKIQRKQSNQIQTKFINEFKVMNAPKEYYPDGYEKSFDDNFKSKIDLPLTSFTCGKQIHFPGLYADVELGCMVFHVCALTDDGLIRKSFLCPESTLFDQTILKCNWWFYVDCLISSSTYDSNIPISKTYQLMKSLAYFSKHNKTR